jgi:hypothetical protein
MGAPFVLRTLTGELYLATALIARAVWMRAAVAMADGGDNPRVSRHPSVVESGDGHPSHREGVFSSTCSLQVK